tara:strand:+ start:4519 stop:5769 length:1251 start_codon:yes stop_codon:yes gene_type:complete
VEKEIKNNTKIIDSINKIVEENRIWISENSNQNKNNITIPIVVHIVHRNSHPNIGSGTNISNAQIEDAIRILNEDFNKNNPQFPNPPRNTFSNISANVQIQFCLATIDEDGNPTNGITRTSTNKTNFNVDTESNDMKKNPDGKPGWDPQKYLNIWVCDLTNQGAGQTLGYSYLPGSVIFSMWKDGLVIDYRYFGTIGVSAPGNDGRTPTHEIGHYLGLLHTFCEETDNNGNPICCDNDDVNWGGNIDDTPASKGIYFGQVDASTNNNSCNDLNYPNIFNTNVLDMDENFMAYSSNTWMFTQKQANVMIGTMNGFRNSLKNSNVTVNCSGTVGFNNMYNSNIRIYPNPSDGEILIQDPNNYDEKLVIIRNMIGKIVYTNLSSKSLININLPQLKNGVYFIEINTNNGNKLEKIIITK